MWGMPEGAEDAKMGDEMNLNEKNGWVRFFMFMHIFGTRGEN